DLLGPVAYRIGEEHLFLGKEIQEPRDFGEGTANLIDDEVRRILRDVDERAYNLLRDNRPLMEKLVEALLQKEELLREEIDQILGVPPAQHEANGLVGETKTVVTPEGVEQRNGSDAGGS